MKNENEKAADADDFPVVCIGASAGGLEAGSSLLRSLPSDTGMAFIFVQHLDPNQDSIVPDLFAKLTRMPVSEAREDMPVERNHLYILPPNKSMTLTDGHLRLSPRVQFKGVHMPIDHFLRSLAEVHGARAIGVILSGNATDGTLGLKAIKAEGGITFAQEPDSAKFDGMPRSAINSHCVDFVLPVEDIGRELGRLGKHPYVQEKEFEPEELKGDDKGGKPADKSKPFDKESFERICLLLKKLSGVDFRHYKDTTIRRRIARRMLVNKLERLADYVEMLHQNRTELEALYQDILIKVTRFFRDPDGFDFLKSTVFPPLFKNREPDAAVRVWVPGCSTGEEVYSIAICLFELMGDIGTNPSIQIFATDVSDQAIQYAREGKYLENISMDVSPERLRRFFVRVEGGYQISKTIRDVCIFARQNMTSDPPFSRLDLISCRNVLIYLDTKLQKRVIPLFHYALKPTGYLVLGTSETVGSFTDLFLPLDKHHKVFSKRAPSSRTLLDFSTVYPIEQLDRKHGAPEVLQDENWRIQDAQRDADRIILTRYSAAGVVINQDMEIIQFRGDTSPFLEHSPGQPSLNVLKMARNGISLELRAMIHEVKTAGTAIKKSVVLNEGGTLRTLKIDALPLEVPNAKGSYFLILFEDDHARTEKLPEQPASNSPVNPLQRRYDQVSAELSATKQHLQSIIEEHESTNEELQSAHEEVLSSNEELQSINEELETAKEELQSTNEELITVNEELQNRNAELSLLNNDLTNLLSSVNIPIVMLSSDLRIRRFTPLAEKLLSLIATDVGRPIGDIKPRINVPDLEAMVTEVMDSMLTKEVDVQDKDGRWYSMKIRPYRTRDNKIEGAVIALFDIDVMRKHISEAERFEDVVDAIIQAVRDPVLVLDFNFKVTKANESFQSMFQTRLDAIKGETVFKVADGLFEIQTLRKLLESIVDDERVNAGTIEHTFNNKRLSLSVRRVTSGTQPLRSIVIAINPT